MELATWWTDDVLGTFFGYAKRLIAHNVRFSSLHDASLLTKPMTKHVERPISLPKLTFNSTLRSLAIYFSQKISTLANQAENSRTLHFTCLHTIHVLTLKQEPYIWNALHRKTACLSIKQLFTEKPLDKLYYKEGPLVKLHIIERPLAKLNFSGKITC